MARRLAVALTALLLLLGGCVDAREMNQLALVVAVGIDKADTPGRYQVTIQVARPGGKAGAKGGGGGDASGGEPVLIASADGDTIFGAIRNLAQFVSRRIMWAHNNVVVVGEALAREDLTPVIDFFTRNQELRMRTWLVVARDTEARKIISMPTGVEKIPADSISALFRYARLPGETVPTDVGEVAAAFFGPDVHPVIAAIGIRDGAYSLEGGPDQGPQPQVELAGTAIIRRNKLVGYVQRDSGRGLLWLREKMANAVVTVPCPEGRHGNMAIEVRAPRIAITPRLTGNVPSFSVRVRTDAWLSEQDCSTPTLGVVDLKTYAEKALAAEIRADMEETLQILQEDLRTDAIRFGRMLHVRYPAWWRANRSRWNELFPKVQVQISVQADVSKMGLYVRPSRVKAP